ncbi:4-carboxymuconolactone decarboxylase [Desulfarculales bacterium]
MVAALPSISHAILQLEVPIHSALNVGLTRQEVVEVIMQMAVYAGFPAALNGMPATKRIFDQRGAQGREPLASGGTARGLIQV